MGRTDSPNRTAYAASYVDEVAAGISSLRSRSWNHTALQFRFERPQSKKIKVMKADACVNQCWENVSSF